MRSACIPDEFRGLVPVLAVVWACCGGASPQQAQLAQSLAAQAGRGDSVASVAFRFAGRRGADVRLYRLPGMDEIAWTFDTPGLVVRDVIGFASDDDEIFLCTPTGELVVLDLNSGRARTADSAVALAATGQAGRPLYARTGGTIAQLGGRTPSVVVDSLPGTVEGLWRATGGRVLIIRSDTAGRTLLTASGSQVAERRELPAGPVAVAPWGDAVAVATDTGLVVLDVMGGQPDRVAPIDVPTTLTFSASGHRIYVATDDTVLLTVERFGLDVLERRTLPVPIDRLRSDRTGRVLLARVREGGRVAVIGLAGDSSVRVLDGTWDDDLPAAAPDGTVLLRRGDSVVVVGGATLAEVTTLPGGGRDRWLVAAWDPRRPALQTARAAPASADSSGARLYVQVSSTSNPEWAEALARDLRLAGMKATVLPPAEFDVTYRVVIGPYASRGEAEAIGRTLGIPYWIYTDTQSPRQ